MAVVYESLAIADKARELLRSEPFSRASNFPDARLSDKPDARERGSGGKGEGLGGGRAGGHSIRRVGHNLPVYPKPVLVLRLSRHWPGYWPGVVGPVIPEALTSCSVNRDKTSSYAKGEL